MKDIKQLAIIGATASGKTSLSIDLAHKSNSHILSLDSLSIYKEIDIASAKPTILERDGILHFGINEIYPNQDFDVTKFIDLYKRAYKSCEEDNKNLIIVGGTGFYLKMLIEGVSVLPKISDEAKLKTKDYLLDLDKSYQFLYDLDKEYISKISSNDSYRIEKALNIYFQTHQIPSKYFAQNKPIPTIQDKLDIYQIMWDRDKLRDRISQRTNIMIDSGLIDEVCMLEKKYTHKPNCMKSIGIKETLDYLNGVYTKDELIEKISINTSRLAKRQTTFNNSQFRDVFRGSLEEIKSHKLLL